MIMDLIVLLLEILLITFSDLKTLEKAFSSAIKKDSVPKELEELAKKRYLWKDVVQNYEKIVEQACNI